MKIRNLIPFKTSILSAPINKFLGLAIFLLVLFNCSVASAQLFPVQVSPQLTPPYSLKLSDYSTSTTEKLLVNLLLTDVNESDLQVRLRFSISGNSVRIQSKNFVQNAAPIQLTGGIPLRLSNLDLQPYFNLQNLDGITPSEYSKPLPDGLYQFCFEVFDWTTGRPLSEKKCYPVYLVLNDPPFLNLPQNGEQVPARDPQNIIFQWTPRHVNATGVEYEFELRELWDTQVDPQTAFLASPNLYQTTGFANTLLYGPGETSLLEGKTYGWRVRAVVSDGISETAVFKNGGYSEIFYFTYTGKCDAPQYILAKSEGTTTEEITWQQNPDHINYQIQFRKEGGSNNVWFESETVETKKKLFFLEAETTYEYRVGGQCVQNGGYSYSAINTFTTPGKEEASEYNCGIPPEIVITNQDPLQQLGVNDVFTAGDFPVTVKEVNGGNGNYTGWGFIVVPYLGDTQIRVTFNNIQINTDKQLTNGIVETEYDKEWGGIDDVADEIQTVKELIDNISQVFKKREEKLNELAALSEEEYQEKAQFIVEELNNYSNIFNNSLETLVNSPYATEEQKEELKNLKLSQDLVDIDNSKESIKKDINNQKEIEKRTTEIAKKIESSKEAFKVKYKAEYENELSKYLTPQQLVSPCVKRGVDEGSRLLVKALHKADYKYVPLSVNKTLIETLICLTEEDKCDGSENEFSYGFLNALIKEFDVATIYETVDDLKYEILKNKIECFNDILKSLIKVTAENNKITLDDAFTETLKCTYGLDISVNDILQAKQLIYEYALEVTTDPYEQGQISEIALSLFVPMPVTKLNLIKKATLLKNIQKGRIFIKESELLKNISKIKKGSIEKLKSLLKRNKLANAGSKLVNDLNLGAKLKTVGKYEVFENGEVFYRAMNKADYNHLVNTGKIRSPLDVPNSEVFTSPTLSYIKSSPYLDNLVIVKFQMKPGTINKLKEIGTVKVTDVGSVLMKDFGTLPVNSKGWMKSNTLFKIEGGAKAQVNIGLGRNGEGMNRFNNNILKFKEVK